jgi:hypothetical protein
VELVKSYKLVVAVVAALAAAVAAFGVAYGLRGQDDTQPTEIVVDPAAAPAIPTEAVPTSPPASVEGAAATTPATSTTTVTPVDATITVTAPSTTATTVTEKKAQ